MLLGYLGYEYCLRTSSRLSTSHPDLYYHSLWTLDRPKFTRLLFVVGLKVGKAFHKNLFPLISDPLYRARRSSKGIQKITLTLEDTLDGYTLSITALLALYRQHLLVLMFFSEPLMSSFLMEYSKYGARKD